MVADEVSALVEVGLAPVQALDAASWGARDYLGAQVLEEGAPADLLVLPADPRDDVEVLRAPTAVVLRGRVVRG
jgi:imidazolonepropionase-like amidohydrolase